MAVESKSELVSRNLRGGETGLAGKTRKDFVLTGPETWAEAKKTAQVIYHAGVARVAESLHQSRLAQARLDRDQQARFAKGRHTQDNWFLAENYVRSGMWTVDELVDRFEQTRLHYEHQLTQTIVLSHALYERRVLQFGESPPERAHEDSLNDWKQALDAVTLGDEEAKAAIKQARTEVAQLRGEPLEELAA